MIQLSYTHFSQTTNHCKIKLEHRLLPQKQLEVSQLQQSSPKLDYRAYGHLDTTCSTKEQNHLMIFPKTQEFPVIHSTMYGTNMVFLQLQRCKFDLKHLQDYLCKYIKRHHHVYIFSMRNSDFMARNVGMSIFWILTYHQQLYSLWLCLSHLLLKDVFPSLTNSDTYSSNFVNYSPSLKISWHSLKFYFV